jgi:tol-pal system protein YbgF
MRKSGALAAGVFTVMSMTALFPASARADADKEHKVIMAEIRMLQEEQQQVRAVLANLSETLKALNTRLDTDAGRTQKAFADQKLVIDGVAETTRILREKADETNVRISSMGQELQTLRQTVASMPAPSPLTVPTTTEPGVTEPAASAAPSPGNPPANISPTQMWDRVYAVYTAGQWDLSVDGFQSYIRTFPTSPQADDAQLYTGYSLYNAGKYQEAVAALQRVISNYPQSDSVPIAYYKMGLSYEAMKQFEPARRAFETVIKNYSRSNEATLAQQALVRIQDKK